MAEECVIVGSINESKFSKVSQDANDSGDELIISGDGDEINSLPYDNTPLVSLNNSTSDLNGAVTTDDGALSSSSPTYSSAMSPVGCGIDAPQSQQQQQQDALSMEGMECDDGTTTKEEEVEANHVKVEMIFETPVVAADDDDDGCGRNDLALAPTPSESTKEKYRQKGAAATSAEVRRSSVGDSPRNSAAIDKRCTHRESTIGEKKKGYNEEEEEVVVDNDEDANEDEVVVAREEEEEEEDAAEEQLGDGGMCVKKKKVSCRRARMLCDVEERTMAMDGEEVDACCSSSSSKTANNGPKMRHASAAAALANVAVGVDSTGIGGCNDEEERRVNGQPEEVDEEEQKQLTSAAVASSSTAASSPTATVPNSPELLLHHRGVFEAVDECGDGVDAIYDENDVQSMDAIERRDFEREQQLIGGVIIRNDALTTTDNKLKLNILNHFATTTTTTADDGRREKQQQSSGDTTATTPTSSRCMVRVSKVKINLSSCLVARNDGDDENAERAEVLEGRHAEEEEEEEAEQRVNSRRDERKSCRRTNYYNVDERESPKQQQFESNSNDSLSSDRSSIITPYITPHNPPSQDDDDVDGGCGSSTAAAERLIAGCSSSKEDGKATTGGSYLARLSACASSTSPGPSTKGCSNTSSVTAATQTTSSQTSPTCQFAGDADLELPAGGSFLDVEDDGKAHFSSLLADAAEASTSRRTAAARLKPLEAALLEPEVPITIPPEAEHDFVEEDAWGECDEGSDVEEVCTCREYTDEENTGSSEDELLPSRDVDLSGYTYDYVHETSGTETPRVSRKRKISEMVYLDGSFIESGGVSGRKRITLEGSKLGKGGMLLSPSSATAGTPACVTTSPSTSGGERRTPRSIIPTKDNPPPELNDWLVQFQRWTQPERLLALDRLIDLCEPTQVRHMMKVIEPQFQRDFISLLPKELALQVLSYLEPRDLLRAAQTCRNWRFLCDDNLLWKEKCKRASIVIEGATDRPKRGRAGNMPPISSPWKAAYIRQSIIEMNWRSRPVREPKVLKGHDDHVITCLQFCGNRIVSGSDDNTLKVWSAITGKCLRTLVGHTGGVWSSQMSANIIISGSTDRTLKVWNADTGQCIHTLYGHTSTVRCMHLHGNKVVSGSRDATLRVWDVTRGICLHILVGHLAAVRCVQYDGKLVVSGAYDYMVKVWNPERAECLHTLQGHTNRVYSLQFDGIHVVSGSLDTSIRVWDAETGSCKHTLMGHQSLTSGMELRQNILVSGNADSTVKVWDILTGQCLQTLSGPNKHQSAVTCLQFNSRFVITSSDDGTVKLWDVKTGEFIRNLVALDSGGSGGVVWRIRSVTMSKEDSTKPASAGAAPTVEMAAMALEENGKNGGGSASGGTAGGSLRDSFKAFSKFGDTKSDGKQITLSQSDKWMKQAKVIDKKITTTDTAIHFKKLKSLKVGYDDYNKFLEDLAKTKGVNLEEIKTKMSNCGQPGVAHVTAGKAAATVNRLTDVSKYTGSHRERFDESGKGKGIAGRKDIPDSSGYVSGYQHKDTYNKTH